MRSPFVGLRSPVEVDTGAAAPVPKRVMDDAPVRHRRGSDDVRYAAVWPQLGGYDAFTAGALLLRQDNVALEQLHAVIGDVQRHLQSVQLCQQIGLKRAGRRQRRGLVGPEGVRRRQRGIIQDDGRRRGGHQETHLHQTVHDCVVHRWRRSVLFYTSRSRAAQWPHVRRTVHL